MSSAANKPHVPWVRMNNLERTLRLGFQPIGDLPVVACPRCDTPLAYFFHPDNSWRAAVACDSCDIAAGINTPNLTRENVQRYGYFAIQSILRIIAEDEAKYCQDRTRFVEEEQRRAAPDFSQHV